MKDILFALALIGITSLVVIAIDIMEQGGVSVPLVFTLKALVIVALAGLAGFLLYKDITKDNERK